MSDKEIGLYDKFHVHRHGDIEGKHEDCQYFVLDLNHDQHARVALAAYAESSRKDYPALSRDLFNILDS